MEIIYLSLGSLAVFLGGVFLGVIYQLLCLKFKIKPVEIKAPQLTITISTWQSWFIFLVMVSICIEIWKALTSLFIK